MPRNSTGTNEDLAEHRRGIQSVEVGVRILNVLQQASGALSLTALSEGADMPASQAHRYLSSYVRTGLVRQNPVTRQYELGPLALNLGLAALSQLDLVALASEAAQAVTASSGLTTLLAVWSGKGAIIIRWNRGAQPVITSLGLGSVLPLLTSATGQVFLSYLPRSATAEAIKLEQRGRQKRKMHRLTSAEIDELRERVRRQEAAWIDGGFIPGLRAFACPVLDYQRDAAAVITLFSALDPIADPKHPAAKTLVEHCAEVNRQAGALMYAAPRHR